MTISDWHQRLRRATRPLHDATEAAFAGFDLRLRADYGAFLCAQADAVLPLEDWVARQGIARHLPDWSARCRGALIRADLAALGIATRAPADIAALDGDPLGIAYVLEGSRLGGRILARIVRSSADCEVAAATRFLAHQGDDSAWRTLLAALDAAASTAQKETAILAGATAAFGVFHRCASDMVRSRSDKVADPGGRPAWSPGAVDGDPDRR